VSFVDALRGWAINDEGDVWRSDDAGLHWDLLAKVTYGERADGFSFVDQLHGWAIEPFLYGEPRMVVSAGNAISLWRMLIRSLNRYITFSSSTLN
jgi:photosystem II stability/assembly factor-like uncharacterized protein